MPKQSPEKALMWSFINLNKVGDTDALLLFFQTNPDFKMEKSDYSELQSFCFGKNIFNNPALMAYIDNISAVRSKLAEGFVYVQSEIIKHDNYINKDSFGVDTNEEHVSEKEKIEKKPMELLKFDKILKDLLLGATWSLVGREKFLSIYSRLPSQYREQAIILEHAKILKSDPSLWEKLISFAIKRNLELVKLLINEKILDVNEQYPLYLNTVLHHYCYYEIKLDTQFLQLCKNNGFNPDIKNSFEQNALYMLIEKDNIEGARIFLDIFKDKLNINEKCKGKTYLHKVILQLEKCNKLNYNNSYANLIAQYTQLFLDLVKLQPSIEIRSGDKSRGTNIISYIEKKISDKGLSESLKNKMLIELEFSKIETKESPKKFKI